MRWRISLSAIGDFVTTLAEIFFYHRGTESTEMYSFSFAGRRRQTKIIYAVN